MHYNCRRPSLSWPPEACQLRLTWSCFRPNTCTVHDGSISFMSSLSLMHCHTCQRPSLSWPPAACQLCLTWPDLIHVLYLTTPSLLWAPLAWCTVPASVHLFHDLPKLANSAWLGAHTGPAGSGVAVIEAQCPASNKIEAAVNTWQKIEFNTKPNKKLSTTSKPHCENSEAWI